eukprot:CAMPEP_0170173576 /NCGR_PEP_ID=MMETSP0040_2-20121228/6865_1 /TAXON_ID=641309 /ORGANISM="Lotharella oceanica, Strain CCMP622" /LENGTH=46 /DNA_ID= /DNA_START= /DNA_END= /DNA_ORIENTATION=
MSSTDSAGVRGAPLFQMAAFYFRRNPAANTKSSRDYNEYKNVSVQL